MATDHRREGEVEGAPHMYQPLTWCVHAKVIAKPGGPAPSQRGRTWFHMPICLFTPKVTQQEIHTHKTVAHVYNIYAYQ